MKTQRKAILWLGIASCLLFGPLNAQAETTLERIKRTDEIRIGITNQFPLSFKQPDGSYGGSEYDLTARLAAKLGVHKIEPVVLGWGSLIPALKAGRIDVVVAGMFIKRERCQQVAFSNPDYQATNTLYVLKGNPKNLHSFDDVTKTPGAMVAAVQGGASALLVKHAGIPEAQIQLFPGNLEMLAALKSGRVDGVSLDTVLGSQFLSENKDSIERAEPFKVAMINGVPDRSFGAFVFRQDDKDLVEAFDAYFKTFLGTPEHIDILKKYGMGPDEVPAKDVTAIALCKS